MIYICLARSVFILCTLLSLTFLYEAHANPNVNYLLKVQELDFEPKEAWLIEEMEGGRLQARQVSFRLFKDSIVDGVVRFHVVAVSSLKEKSKALSITFQASSLEPETSYSASSAIEPSDFVDPSAIENSRSEILELRKQLAIEQSQLRQVQEKVSGLKIRAASLAKLSRLVDAQTTFAGLQQRLAQISADHENLKLLLRTIHEQPSSQRLVSREAVLSRDLKLLSLDHIGTTKQNEKMLSDVGRSEAQKVIDQARGLDLEALNEKISRYQELPNESTDLNDDQSFHERQDSLSLEFERQNQALIDRMRSSEDE